MPLLNMPNSLLLPVLLLFSITAYASSHQILYEIEKTKELINLYQRKLDILISMAHKQNISLPQQNQTQAVMPRSTIFKQQQQLIKQMNYQLAYNSVYMPPSYIANGSTLIDISSKQHKHTFNGTILSVQPYQLTLKLSHGRAMIINIRDKLIQKTINLALPNIPGKWHRATVFQDIFLQANSSTLILSNEKEVRTHEFKSEILDFYTINQYKILFVTRYQFGFLNAKSLQVTDQINFQSIAETSCFNDGILFVLLKNRKLLIVTQQKIVSQQKFQSGLIKDNPQIHHLGNNYLFISYPQQKCFHIFQVCAPNYLLSHYKQICLPKNVTQNSQFDPPYNYEFFKRGPNFRLLLSNKMISKMFQVVLAQKQAANSERIIPWKFVLIVICIIAVVYFKTKKNSGQQEVVYQAATQGRMRAPLPNKMMRKQKVNPNAGQQYIKNLVNDMKRNKIGESNISKKQN